MGGTWPLQTPQFPHMNVYRIHCDENSRWKSVDRLSYSPGRTWVFDAAVMIVEVTSIEKIKKIDRKAAAFTSRKRHDSDWTEQWRYFTHTRYFASYRFIFIRLKMTRRAGTPTRTQQAVLSAWAVVTRYVRYNKRIRMINIRNILYMVYKQTRVR